MNTRKEYLFVDVETGESLSLWLEFQEIMENQQPGGFFEHEGRLLRRDVAAELEKKPLCLKNAGKIEKTGPVKHRSENAFGVHPSQVDEANEYWKSTGIGVEFSRDGSASFSSRGARKKALRHAGFFDKDGGYGD